MVLLPGLTVKTPLVLLATAVPLQLPAYNSQLAPVPRLPPFTVRVAELPGHIPAGTADSDTGAEEFWFTLTVAEAQAVVLHDPLARMK